MDLLIKNAVVVKSNEIIKCDIGIKDGKFVYMGNQAGAEALEVIDAGGNYLIPGVIDVHTHIEHSAGTFTVCDDFADATQAAACGGVTTIIDFVIQSKGQSVIECINNKKKAADSKVYIDYSFHACFTDVNQNSIAEIKDLVSSGIPSIKVFMTFEKLGFMVADGLLYELLIAAKKYGALVGVHAENDSIVEQALDSLQQSGLLGLPYFPLSRPVLAENEAIIRAMTLAEAAGSPLYIYHLSSGQALAKIKQARQSGQKVFAETNPHYLVLTDQVYSFNDAQNYVMSPPLRTESDQELLWEGIKTGEIQVISTDHCPYTRAQKATGANDFTKVPAGIPGIETLLPIIFHEGVQKKKITIQKMVDILCGNPAKIFGLSHKGNISIGMDADFVILDPNKEVTLTANKLHMKSGYTPFEGKKVKGYPVVTAVRGKIIYQDGEFCGEKGFGKFVQRKIS